MIEFSFPEIKQIALEDEIINRLKNAIVTGKFAPGAYLNESEIAKQMALSRIPIREAIKKLEQEGLVFRKPNKGVYVIIFTEQDVREIFSLRAKLESMAFEWAIPNMGTDDIEQLRKIIVMQQTALMEKKYDELARLDMQFHEFICLKAGHSRLLKAWYEQHAQAQMLLNLRFSHLSYYTPDTVPIDHLKILETMERGDIASAVALTNEIGERVSSECVKSLAEFTAITEAEHHSA